MSFIILVTALSGLCIVSAGLIFSLKNREMSEKGRAESERALEAIKTRRVILPAEPENEEGQDLCIYKSSVEGTDYIGTLKIEKLELELSAGVNILYGDNAQGKTNVLEALFMGCTTKSQKAAKEREVIRFGQDESHIRLYVNKGGINRKIDMHLKKNSPKGVAIDGIPIAKSAELYGMMNIISFSPDDLTIIKNGPAERRRFIDMELCQLDRSYLYNLSNYNKALTQRSMLLKQISDNKELESTLSIWDEQLVRFGEEIISKRAEFIREMGETAADIHKTLTDDEEELKLKYVPNSAAGHLGIDLAMSHERDIILKMNNVGPHRDDLEFEINHDDARKYGSQGQQRTVALTLKLAEIELVKKKVGDNPVLLLDDVLSELDRNRQTQLLNSISDIQTVITCTGLEEFVNGRISCDRIYRVEKGTVAAADGI